MAAGARDGRALERMLHPGVVLTVDGGGVVPAPTAALRGASGVGAYLAAMLCEASTAVRADAVNGVPGIVVCRQGRVTGVLSVRIRGDRVREAWLVLNPEKLLRWTC